MVSVSLVEQFHYQFACFGSSCLASKVVCQVLVYSTNATHEIVPPHSRPTNQYMHSVRSQTSTCHSYTRFREYLVLSLCLVTSVIYCFSFLFLLLKTAKIFCHFKEFINSSHCHTLYKVSENAKHRMCRNYGFLWQMEYMCAEQEVKTVKVNVDFIGTKWDCYTSRWTPE